MKLNYCVKLSVNMNIADSSSSYFNCLEGHFFILGVKQNILDKRDFFKMNKVNYAIVNWRENDRDLLTSFAIIRKLFRQKIISKITSFP